LIVFVGLVRRTRTIVDYATVHFSSTSAIYAEKDAIAATKTCEMDEMENVFTKEKQKTEYIVIHTAEESRS
jgi:UDP-glucose 4-epimerase